MDDTHTHARTHMHAPTHPPHTHTHTHIPTEPIHHANWTMTKLACIYEMPGLNLSFDNDNPGVLHVLLQSLKADSWIAPPTVTTSFHTLSHSLFANHTSTCCCTYWDTDSIINISHKHVVDHGPFQLDYTLLQTPFMSNVTISCFSITHSKWGCNVHQNSVTLIQNAAEPKGQNYTSDKVCQKKKNWCVCVCVGAGEGLDL
jgi:hypothetical protein